MHSRSFTLTARVAALALIGIAGLLSIVASDNGSGGMTSGGGGTTSSIFPRYAYVANTGDDSVSTYVVDAASGRLKWIGRVAAGTQPVSAAIDPSGKYVYVANSGSGTVTPYSIATDGSLTPIDCDTGLGGVQACTAGTTPVSVTVDPSGKYVYVANSGSDNVSQYTIGSNGHLALLSPATAVGFAGPSGVAVSGGSAAVRAVPKYAYVANGSASASVSAYSIAAGSGVLTRIACIGGSAAGCNGSDFFAGALSSSPSSVVVDPTGKFAYVANGDNSGSVSAYSISASTGTLTRITCSSGCNGTDFLAGTSPSSVAIDPTGRFAYVANGSGTASVSAYSIDATTGVLTKINCSVGVCNGTDFPAGTSPSSVAIDPTGRFVYVANFSDGNVSQYTINADGSLAPMTPATVTSIGGPQSVTVDPSGRFVYVANASDGNVSQYSIGTNGALTAITTAIASGAGAQSVTVDPSGRFAYVANSNDSNVSQLRIGVNGSLTTITPALANPGTLPASVTAIGTWQ